MTCVPHTLIGVALVGAGLSLSISSSEFYTARASARSGITYHLAPAADGGNDSNDGLSPHTPWLTPHHPLNCGDVILAAKGRYAPAQFNYDWGTVTCPAENDVAWLECVTFDACVISGMAPGQNGIGGMGSYWGLQGFEIDGTSTSGPCILVYPVGSSEIRDIVIAGNVLNGCGGSGITADPATLSRPTNDGVDYLAIIGNIVYNSARTTSYCATGIEIYQPIAADTLPGTHIYVAGNFVSANVDPSICGGSGPTEGEAIEFDDFSGDQTTKSAYTQQAVADNNLLLANGGPGLEAYDSSSSHIYFRHNTIWGNNTDAYEYVPAYVVGESVVDDAVNVAEFYDLAVTSAVDGARRQPIYSYWVSNGDATDYNDNNWGFAVGRTTNGTHDSGGFSYGSNNQFGSSPRFVHPIAPPPPSCGAAKSVVNCMAEVIADFTPTASGAGRYGYRVPSSTSVYDPLFPRWLCKVNLPRGLVTKGCEANLKPAAGR